MAAKFDKFLGKIRDWSSKASDISDSGAAGRDILRMGTLAEIQASVSGGAPTPVVGPLSLTAANAATYTGKTLTYSAPSTVTVNVDANVYANLVPPASGALQIKSDGVVLLNGSTDPVAFTVANGSYAVLMPIGANSYAVALSGGAVPPAFTPVSLFGAGEKGCVYDIAKISSLFAAPAGSPVTASGDTIGQINDLTGNAYNAFQDNVTKRPLYIVSGGLKAARFDGANDFLRAAGTDFTGTRATVVLGVKQSSGSGLQMILEHGTAPTASGGFDVVMNNGAAGKVGGGLGDGAAYLFNDSPVSSTVPRSYVISAAFDYSQTTNQNRVAIRIDGVAVAETQVAAAGTITSAAMAIRDLYIGSRGGASMFASMDLYAAVVINRALTNAEMQDVERWCAGRSGTAVPFDLAQVQYADTWAVVDQGAYNLVSEFAQVVFLTEATILELDAYSTIYSTFPGFSGLGVYVNGAWFQSVGVPAQFAYTGRVYLPAGTKKVSIVAGLQSRPILSNPPIGTFLTAIRANAKMTTVTPTESNRLLIYGDSIASGGNATTPTKEAWAMLARAERSGSSTAVEGYGYRSLKDDCADAPSIAAFVTKIQAYSPSKLWVAIGTNDYGLSKWGADEFGAAYAALLDGLHAAMPALVLQCQTPLLRATEAANGFGSTLGAFRAAIASAVAARAWATFVDGTSILSLQDLDDGLHPTTAGHAKYAEYVRSLGV